MFRILNIRVMSKSTNGQPPSSHSRSPIALSRRLYQIAVARAAEVHDGFGIVPLEFAILIHLNASPGIDQNTLSARLALDRTSTGALVHGLEQKGLVTRAISSTDRRARILNLTTKGAALHAKLRPRGEAAQAEILSVLSPAERKSLIDMLVRVIAANEAYVRPGAGRRKRAQPAIAAPR
jgi:MarR family transcriptional regulator, temperature-dependent positive regulator of motility